MSNHNLNNPTNEVAEDYVLKTGNYLAKGWNISNTLPTDPSLAGPSMIVSSAAMVSAVRKFDKSSSRLMRISLSLSGIALLISLVSLIISWLL